MVCPKKGQGPGKVEQNKTKEPLNGQGRNS
jgi:hypothetical protein